MERIRYIAIFIDTMREFLDYLAEKYPEFKADLYITKTSMNLLAQSNPRVVVEQFMSYILPYAEHIQTCNEEFFLNFDNLVTNNTDSKKMMFAVRIRSIWVDKHTSQLDKAQIWIYFKKFLKFGKIVISD